MSRWPWWGSVILAVVFYNGLKYGIPKWFPVSVDTAGFLALLAPLGAAGFLLLAAKQLYDGTAGAEDSSESGGSGE